jgi:hypothetical protein
MWWGKRKKRGTRLSRELALGALQDAMGRVEEQQGSSGPVPVPETGRPALAEAQPEQDPLLAADVPAASSDQPSAGEASPDLKGQLPAQRRPGRAAPRPAPRPTGPDPSVSPSPRAEGSARDRLLC